MNWFWYDVSVIYKFFAEKRWYLTSDKIDIGFWNLYVWTPEVDFCSKTTTYISPVFFTDFLTFFRNVDFSLKNNHRHWSIVFLRNSDFLKHAFLPKMYHIHWFSGFSLFFFLRIYKTLSGITVTSYIYVLLSNATVSDKLSMSICLLLSLLIWAVALDTCMDAALTPISRHHYITYHFCHDDKTLSRKDHPEKIIVNYKYELFFKSVYFGCFPEGALSLWTQHCCT